MKPLKGLLILGFGGHARSVADVALSVGIPQLCFIDSNARPGEMFCSFPVKAAFDFELEEGWAAISASGNNLKRAEHVAWLEGNGLPVATLISSFATIGVGAQIAVGSFVAHHAHVGPMATIGAGCIINTGAVVEHECAIGAFTHVSVNSVVAGRSSVGNRCFIGAGATVIDGINLANDIVLGAGGCATRDLDTGGVYVGVPAKRVGPIS
ncbi:TPA: NeuD/PglB/VioB family sugar acetyltransferase [Pseudomonas putida]|nr:NeuD/PglB/VioB family sugar acetyltransferase [Pseudomonas putida]